MDTIVPLVLACVGLGTAAPSGPVPLKPKLVVMITVDQMRADYLTRWRSQLTGGLAQLLGGAVFSNAFQDHAVTETAPGHSTVLSGRWPAHTGILTNALGVGDSTAPLLEVRGPGASPHRFRGTAFFDWLAAAQPAARALSVSRKDRGAILPIGRAKQDVYWYQDGRFTTSRYYRDSLPRWVRAFNALRIPFRAAGREWHLLLPDSAYAEADSVPWENGGHDVAYPHRLPTDSARAANAYRVTPLMDSLTLAFALAGTEALRLGRRGTTDLLAVSLSATDYIGHTYGPDSREIHDDVLRLDRTLGWFLGRLMDRYGRDNLLVVLSADHGVTSYPEFARAHGHPEARWVSVDTIVRAVNQQLDRLTKSATPRVWLEFDSGMLFVQDNGRLAALGMSIDSVLDDIAHRISAVAGVARVDRPESLAATDTAADPVARRWLHQLPSDAGVGLVVTLDDRDVWAYAGGLTIAAHGQPSDRDAHVPLLIWGKGVRAGTYGARVSTVDIAPTLARLLGLTPLSLPDGRVLAEAIAER